MFHRKTARDMTHEQAHGCDEAANHQLPIAVAFWIIQIVSMEERSSLIHNLMKIHCSARSVILNVMATRCQCLMPSIPPLTSMVKSSLFTHVHSSSLSLAARLHQCRTNHSHYINCRGALTQPSGPPQMKKKTTKTWSAWGGKVAASLKGEGPRASLSRGFY